MTLYHLGLNLATQSLSESVMDNCRAKINTIKILYYYSTVQVQSSCYRLDRSTSILVKSSNQWENVNIYQYFPPRPINLWISWASVYLFSSSFKQIKLTHQTSLKNHASEDIRLSRLDWNIWTRILGLKISICTYAQNIRSVTQLVRKAK